MADAADLKSAGWFLLYGFESRLRHHFQNGIPDSFLSKHIIPWAKISQYDIIPCEI